MRSLSPQNKTTLNQTLFETLSVPAEQDLSRAPRSPTPDDLLISPCDFIPTPTDDRGLVNLPALLDAVDSCVVDGYLWRGEGDPHHSYWTKKMYTTPNLFRQNEKVSALFRSLPIHIVELPREFHDFLHVVTTPVEPPEEEVMRYRIESWRVALELFRSVDTIKNKKFISEDVAARRVNRRIVAKKFRYIEECLKSVDRLPPEFVFFDVSPLQIITGHEKATQIRARDINRSLNALMLVGKAARRGSIERTDLAQSAA